METLTSTTPGASTARHKTPGTATQTSTTIAPAMDIIEVTNKKQLKTFLELPFSIYTESDTKFVMPLNLHMKMMMGKLGTPQKHFFIAYADHKPVARLGVKVHKAAGHEPRLHFGFFECVKGYPQAVRALIERAHSMYPELEMMGPFHFRQEDPYIGILVEGFDLDPYFMMPYNPPYYDEYLKAAGLSTIMDLFTYEARRTNGIPPQISENAKHAQEALGLTFRSLDKKNLNKEARIIAGIFNEALADNWGYEEFLDDQIKEMVDLLKLFIDARMVGFAQHEGKDVGCLIMIPNYNHIMKPSRGSLTAGLIWRYLRRYKTTKSIRGYALGVLKKYHGKGIGSFLTAGMWQAAEPADYDHCEISWVLSNNSPMNELAKVMGGKQNKIYRLYDLKPKKG